MTERKLVRPRCPGCDGSAFHVRAMKDEAVGVASCAKCERSYLLLDSGDHWFDLIQERRPREARSPCKKSKGLALELEYYFRGDGDVESVNVWTVCAKCRRRVRRFTADFGGADQLAKDEAAFWKQREIIRISSPTNYGIGDALGTLFYIEYAMERLDGERAVPKSDAFRVLARGLEEWLGAHFVSWRGPRCFDNPDEHRRLFGAR